MISIVVLVAILTVIYLIMKMINTYIPMEAGISKAVNIIVMLATILWLLFFVIFNYSSITIGR
jgi:hypothetical protein